MMILAETVNPGVCCVHGGIPDVMGISGDLCYSDPRQPLINSAMARLNLWVTGIPSAQSGGSTSIINDIPAAQDFYRFLILFSVKEINLCAFFLSVILLFFFYRKPAKKPLSL
ncbi:MAG: hypothetical protein U9P10_00170 [Thermodesulfobacteriota bacterium]|nr:hypothetical protein [Thermodesulfobacteriota bacterium]